MKKGIEGNKNKRGWVGWTFMIGIIAGKLLKTEDFKIQPHILQQGSASKGAEGDFSEVEDCEFVLDGSRKS